MLCSVRSSCGARTWCPWPSPGGRMRPHTPWPARQLSCTGGDGLHVQYDGVCLRDPGLSPLESHHGLPWLRGISVPLSTQVEPPHGLKIRPGLTDRGGDMVGDGPNLHLLQLHHRPAVLDGSLDDDQGVALNIFPFLRRCRVIFLQLYFLSQQPLGYNTLEVLLLL